MGDLFSKHYSHLESPAADAFAITPSDSADLTTSTRSIYVGGSGDINLVTVDGTTILFSATVAGSVLPVRAKQILSTSTTATNLVGLV